MKQLITPKILSRILVLCFMIAGAVYVTSFDTQQVLAAPCCQECDQYHADCLAGCNGNSACIQSCNQQNNNCIRHCIMCDNGPGCTEDWFCQMWGYSSCSGGYCVY